MLNTANYVCFLVNDIMALKYLINLNLTSSWVQKNSFCLLEVAKPLCTGQCHINAINLFRSSEIATVASSPFTRM